MPMGEFIKLMLTRLEWFETRYLLNFGYGFSLIFIIYWHKIFYSKCVTFFISRFPRIAVNSEKVIREKLDERAAAARLNKKEQQASNSQVS